MARKASNSAVGTIVELKTGCMTLCRCPAGTTPKASPTELLAPARALPYPQARRVIDHDHHGVAGAAHRDTVITAPPR